MLKKITFGLVALGLSASAYAAGPGGDVSLPAAPAVNVTIPQQVGSWAFGLEALYQKPDNGDMHYAVTHGGSTVDGVTTTTANKVRAVDPDFDWGGHIDVSYLFAGNGRDVTLGYTHFHTGDNSSVNDSNMVINDTFTHDRSSLTDWDSAKGSVDDLLDIVDLTFGQKMEFGERVQLHAFGGLRYAGLEQDSNGYYKLTGTTTVNTLDGKLDSEFKGLGPRAGMDADVKLGGGFSITGRIAGSLLVGNLDEKYRTRAENITASSGALGSATVDTYHVSGKNRVVPELDARLGVKYGTEISQGVGASFELGYEVENYFDVESDSRLAYTAADTTGHETDFGRHGAYLRLQIDVA